MEEEKKTMLRKVKMLFVLLVIWATALCTSEKTGKKNLMLEPEYKTVLFPNIVGYEVPPNQSHAKRHATFWVKEKPLLINGRFCRLNELLKRLEGIRSFKNGVKIEMEYVMLGLPEPDAFEILIKLLELLALKKAPHIVLEGRDGEDGTSFVCSRRKKQISMPFRGFAHEKNMMQVIDFDYLRNLEIYCIPSGMMRRIFMACRFHNLSTLQIITNDPLVLFSFRELRVRNPVHDLLIMQKNPSFAVSSDKVKELNEYPVYMKLKVKTVRMFSRRRIYIPTSFFTSIEPDKIILSSNLYWGLSSTQQAFFSSIISVYEVYEDTDMKFQIDMDMVKWVISDNTDGAATVTFLPDKEDKDLLFFTSNYFIALMGCLVKERPGLKKVTLSVPKWMYDDIWEVEEIVSFLIQGHDANTLLSFPIRKKQQIPVIFDAKDLDKLLDRKYLNAMQETGLEKEIEALSKLKRFHIFNKAKKCTHCELSPEELKNNLSEKPVSENPVIARILASTPENPALGTSVSIPENPTLPGTVPNTLPSTSEKKTVTKIPENNTCKQIQGNIEDMFYLTDCGHIYNAACISRMFSDTDSSFHCKICKKFISKPLNCYHITADMFGVQNNGLYNIAEDVLYIEVDVVINNPVVSVSLLSAVPPRPSFSGRSSFSPRPSVSGRPCTSQRR